jgi:hypothetical protein
MTLVLMAQLTVLASGHIAGVRSMGLGNMPAVY